MKVLTEYKWVQIAIILSLVAFGCQAVFAEEQQNDSEQEKKVLTPLQQRMQRKISVDFRETPMEDVLRAMAEQADVDIVKSPKVAGQVTATLTDVPLEEALSNILAAHGYAFVADKNMIRVAPSKEITDRSEKMVSRIYRITYADVEQVAKALKNFISTRGSLSINPGTSNVIVTDTESKVKAIDSFVEEIDRITPQILVEARIYDITSKDRLDLGIEWAAGTRTEFVNGKAADFNRDPFIGSTFSGTIGKTESTTGALRFGWLNSNIDIDVLLNAQQENICAKLLANPRVLVLDNETASIKIVSEIPYIELTESSEGGSFGTTDFREVGVELEVTPHLTRDEMIRLRLIPQFSVQTGTVNVGGTGQEKYPQPVVDRRTADTILLVENGHTIVLGGLRKKDVTQQKNKVPLLGDLPLVGALFRFEGEDTVTSELVVFITPWIIEKPALSETEQQQLKLTQFSGPEVVPTRAEKQQQ